MLADRSIRRMLVASELRVEGLNLLRDDAQLQSNSLDLRLGEDFRVNTASGWEDLRGKMSIFPGQFVLGCTQEYIAMSPGIAGQLNGKSSLGRRGLLVHQTAGFVDAGFCGVLTLELSNVSQQPIVLEPGMLIAQLAFFQLSEPAERPYGAPGLGSHYQGQKTTQLSLM
jgi:dCTP deaminase